MNKDYAHSMQGDLISRQDATTMPVMPKEHRTYQTFNLDDAYEQGWLDLQRCIDELPSAEPPYQYSEAYVTQLRGERDILQDMVDNMAKPKTGRWARKTKEINDCDGHRAYYWYECDNCGARPPKDQWGHEWHSDFCPKCGAKMEVEE